MTIKTRNILSIIFCVICFGLLFELFEQIYEYKRYYEKQEVLNSEFQKTIKNGDSVNVSVIREKCRVDTILNDSMIKITMFVKKTNLTFGVKNK